MLARIPREELEQLLRGYEWVPMFVEGDDPVLIHESMALALDAAIDQIRAQQTRPGGAG